jgi:hypothetical protein
VRKGRRGVAVKAGWDGICSQCLALVVKEEAMDVRPRIEEKKKGKTLKTRQVEHVVDRRSDMVDLVQCERGSKVWPRIR